MYAVIETGGKQVKVEVGQEIYIEKLNVEAEETYTFDKVLMIGGDKTKIGKPYVKNATVTAKVVKMVRVRKLLSINTNLRNIIIVKMVIDNHILNLP